MNILYGLDQNIRFKEIDELIKCGVTEFFLGIMPPEWINKYGWEIGLNKRTSKQDNFIDYKKLEETINYLIRRDKKAYIVFNDFSYIKDQITDIEKIVRKVEKFNPYGYIIGDVSLILQFEKWKILKPIHVSITGGCLNQYSVDFFKQFKHVESLALPRYLSLEEIEKIRNNTNLKLSCFAETGGCEFGEEYCFTFHSRKEEFFCNRKFKVTSSLENDKDLFDCVLKNELRCGLCAIYYFKKIGIDTIKYPSRGHMLETFESLKLFKMVCACDNLDEVKQLQKDKSKCDNSYCAYYSKGIE